MNSETTEEKFEDAVLGHRPGLFVLFFTEMWERFSFYGMRVLLINFLTAAAIGTNPGWDWSAENAGALFGTYAGLLYITPILGGMIADKWIGYRWAVVVGATIMTLGHAAMAFDTELTLYLGLALLVIGTGFFKPTMTSIISALYEKHQKKKDGAFTIYYMGVNAGAFFGMMLCGYLAEKIGWAWGFGLAGVFMMLGTLQFWLSKPLFGKIGDVPQKKSSEDQVTEKELDYTPNSFSVFDKILIVVVTVLGMLYIFNDPLSKIGQINILPKAFLVDPGLLSGPVVIALIGVVIFIALLIIRIIRYEITVLKRMFAVVILAFFTIFFWMSFEQGATSLVLFARDFTDRTLEGTAGTVFNVINGLIAVSSLGILTWVLILLFKQTMSKIAFGNIVLAISIIGVWVIVGWMLYREFTANVTEVTTSWFSTLNSFFIITLAPLFSKWWESKYNPSGAIKFGLGLIIMGVGFALLSYGALPILKGTAVGIVKVSMVWLIFAYLFHTMGELCISPLGLSYLSKLVPARMIGFMFGMWYLAIAIGNKLAATVGGMSEEISKEYSMSGFFFIVTAIPVLAGVLVMLLNPLLNRLMHGVR